MRQAYEDVVGISTDVYKVFKEFDSNDELTKKYDITKEAFEISFSNRLLSELGCTAIDLNSIEVGVSLDSIMTNFFNTIKNIDIKRNAISVGGVNVTYNAGKALYNIMKEYDKIMETVVYSISKLSEEDTCHEPLLKVVVLDITTYVKENVIPIYLDKYAPNPFNISRIESDVFKGIMDSHYRRLSTPTSARELNSLDLITVKDAQKSPEGALELLHIYHAILTDSSLNLTDNEETALINRLSILSFVLNKVYDTFKRLSNSGRLILDKRGNTIYINNKTLDVIKVNQVNMETIYGYVLDGKQIYLKEEHLLNKDENSRMENIYKAKYNKSEEQFIKNKAINSIELLVYKLNTNLKNINGLKIKENCFNIKRMTDCLKSHDDLLSYVLDVVAKEIGGGYVEFSDMIKRDFINRRFEKEDACLVASANLLAIIMSREITVHEES